MGNQKETPTRRRGKLVTRVFTMKTLKENPKSAKLKLGRMLLVIVVCSLKKKLRMHRKRKRAKKKEPKVHIISMVLMKKQMAKRKESSGVRRSSNQRVNTSAVKLFLFDQIKKWILLS